MSRLIVDYGKKTQKKKLDLYYSHPHRCRIMFFKFIMVCFRFIWQLSILTISLCLTISQMYNVIDQQLDLDYVDYSHLNNVIAKIISSYTILKRFNNIENSKFFFQVCPYHDLQLFHSFIWENELINDYTRKKQNQIKFIKNLKRKEHIFFKSITQVQHRILQRQYQELNQKLIFQ
ncbi:unnamed protein product [Paramecium pentaurelia]|uniref:Transmembrane protein n=1 Tax=Paramecium pentaurelia TaxID=43138 RepID=A0A8S1VU93_9CILI|nr:unnamed protein product [Paramecium pentaurelia]